MLSSTAFFSISNKDIGFLGIGRDIEGFGKSIGLNTLGLGMGIGILDLWDLVNKNSNCFLDIFL